MADPELIEAVLGDYLDRLQEEAAAANSSEGRLRTPRPAVDIDGFFRLVGNAIQQQQLLEGVANPISYLEDTPEEDDNLTGETIVYSLLERLPGHFEQKNLGMAMSNRTMRQRKKLFREAIKDPDNPGMKIFTYGEWFDNTVCFKVYARTNKVANRRALWLEDTIDRWIWYLKASGLSEIAYLGRGADEYLSPENRKIVCRPLHYYIRTEKVTVVREHILRQLNISGGIE